MVRRLKCLRGEKFEMKTKIGIYVVIILLILNFIFSILVGKKSFSLKESITILTSQDKNNPDYIILVNIRIPRTVATYFVGAGLAVCGCVLQSIFLNPLCESYTLGISSAAGLGVILGYVIGSNFSRFIMSLLGSFLGLGSIYFLTLIFRKTLDISFVLSGIVLNFLFSSITVLLTFFLDPYKVHFVLSWLLGGFSAIKGNEIFISGTIIFLCIITILFHSRAIDVLVLGREKSISLGVNEYRLKNILILLVIIISTLCVSIAGIISFVGIIIPNIIKEFTGLEHKKWLFFSAVTGAIFVSLADNLAKNLFYPVEIPISVITGILGSIVFVSYIVKFRMR